ncbi:MAG TPA: DUF2334 domain-containing protein [Ottowia sp.]|uniref:DUF2334 domain-containing protein n=1 Tax=Ottowia sp. TaxID=1898956 RepID=UPI002BC7EB56|nr:DUF2334 domain-containing protein [Ottowia sp.]HMN22155.1 DUF2334 domain-containing protein [Ottowia sp.]
MKTTTCLVAALSALCLTLPASAQVGKRTNSLSSLQRLTRAQPAQTVVRAQPAAANPASVQAAPRTLVLYDAPQGQTFSKLGMAYAIMLRNLLGHFDSSVDMVPVQDYVAGQVNNYDATFYLGSYYDNPVPASFMADVTTTDKTVVWFKYNLWQMAWDANYDFQNRFGFGFNGLRGLNALPTAADPAPGFFDTITYKSLPFVKYYAYDNGAVAADPDVGVVGITDPAKAASLVPMSNPKTGESAPYIVRSGNFWYVADLPLSYIGPRDRYLVLADVLHDMLGIEHAEDHKAMVRLEDVGALVSVSAMQTLTDYLHQKQIPFSVATIPYYADPLGTYNGDVPMFVPMSQAGDLKTSLNYALARGGEIVMHGYTHQYSNMRNLYTGVSGDDYEFWNIVDNKPVAEDSLAWAQNRYAAGLQELASGGYAPTAWETPHYHGSALASKAAAQTFAKTYQRVVYFTADNPDFNASVNKDFWVGQMYPYPIKTDYYGQRVLPESLGNIEYDISAIDPTSNYNYTWQDIVTNAQYVKTVRDGYASFFFHPFWLEPDLGTPGFADFKKTIDGINNLGFTWTVPSQSN